MASKFNFNEIVIVSSKKHYLQKINGCEGVVKGKSQCETTGKWGYGVSIPRDEDLVWSAIEEDLISTGRTDYTNKSKANIKVKVDPKTGEGEAMDISTIEGKACSDY